MKILYVCGENITKPSCGCAHRSRFVYDALTKLGDVTVLNPRDVGKGSLLYRLFEIPFLKLTKVAHWPFRNTSSIVHLHLPPSPKYDAVVCRYLFNVSLICAWKIAPCYVDVDDLPVDAFNNVEGKRLPFWMRPFCGLMVKIWQRYCLRQCTGAWAVTPAQQKIIGRYVKCGYLPNIARPPAPGYDVNAQQEELLMTVGLMGYEPNYTGVDWFLTNIWPRVHEKWPNLHYAIAGNGVPADLRVKWMAQPNVEVLGFVDDVDALYAKALAVVAPILSGAGTCIKVVEAGLHGRITLATNMAARGQDVLMPFGGIKVFEDASVFCDLLSGLGGRDRAALQQRISVETNRVNSIGAFSKSVKKIVES